MQEIERIKEENLRLKSIISRQNLEIENLEQVKSILDMIYRSKFWNLRRALFEKNIKIVDRIKIIIRNTPGVSTLYKYVDFLFRFLKRKSFQNTKADKLISVVIPYYNYSQYITECVDSIRDQGLGDKVEIIIIEGGSTDGSKEFLTNQKWSDVQIYYQPNRCSIGENRLKGLEIAEGRYICMLDADDKLAPNYLKKAIEILETEYYDVVYPNYEFFDEASKIMLPQRFELADIFIYNYIPPIAVFRKSFWLEKQIGYNLSRDIFEDWDFWMRMAMAGARFKKIDIIGFYYRVHTLSSLSMTDNRAQRDKEITLKTKEPFLNFPNSKDFLKARSRQYLIYSVKDKLINIKW